ncbi:alkylphosphonate utilization protein [Pseudoruegeria sp. SK021]|uniref:alkylphosphonate utilization protein n=1 Tax=Pseudoruegeria sp. SK021 TaxID=1933035 RepID=UPI000A22E22E|nr:alkylphosphonate utilization protein [Pseudoruegeria sp. SK021]OSP56726.1 PhnA protein [Pseudoruegeria sp. SK021]
MTCPLCATDAACLPYTVGPSPHAGQVELCAVCIDQIAGTPDPAHWRALSTTMWSEDPAIQVLAWRMLDRLSSEVWTRDLLEMLYLDDDTRAWAEAGRFHAGVVHRDANGVTLETGDTVTLIKDLTVKGAGFTAKRGTSVPRISLVADNADQIEGRVEGQRIVILTEFVKKR